MRRFALFFSIALTIYSLVNAYIFFKGLQVLPVDGLSRAIYTIIFIVIAGSFITGRILERKALSRFSETLTWIGSFWLAWMLYLFLFTLLSDLILLSDSVLHFLPQYKLLTPVTVAGSAVILTFIVVISGHINARCPRLKTLNLEIQKTANGRKELNMVIASDIHLGTIIGKSRLDKIVEKINQLDSDIVLLPGDVVDEDLAPVIKENLGESLRNIRSRHGVYSVTGNHEFIGGANAATRYLTDHGIRVLRDESVLIDGRFYLIGREDRSVSGFTERRRKSLQDLLAGLNKELPIILMDHQPFHLEEAVQNGIDLQLSGHTHHGQLWPFNFITKKVFELSWGYKKKGNTHIYVSCGVGTWGPPVRTAKRPEIVQIKLIFADQ
jgi:hypothetical protein